MTAIPAAARQQGVISVQEHLHQDTALKLPPPIPEAELVDASAPEMRQVDVVE